MSQVEEYATHKPALSPTCKGLAQGKPMWRSPDIVDYDSFHPRPLVMLAGANRSLVRNILKAPLVFPHSAMSIMFRPCQKTEDKSGVKLFVVPGPFWQ